MAITTLNLRGLNRTDTATSGQVVTATSAVAADFQDAAGGNILQVKGVSSGTEGLIQSTSSCTGTSVGEYTSLGMTFTPTLSTSILMIDYNILACHDQDYCGLYFLTYNHSGISETIIENSNTYGATHGFDYSSLSTTSSGTGIAGKIFLSLATTNEITFKSRFTNSSGGATSGTLIYQSIMINRIYGGNCNNYTFAGVSTFTVSEIATAVATISDTDIDN